MYIRRHHTRQGRHCIDNHGNIIEGSSFKCESNEMVARILRRIRLDRLHNCFIIHVSSEAISAHNEHVARIKPATTHFELRPIKHSDRACNCITAARSYLTGGHSTTRKKILHLGVIAGNLRDLVLRTMYILLSPLQTQAK